MRYFLIISLLSFVSCDSLFYAARVKHPNKPFPAVSPQPSPQGGVPSQTSDPRQQGQDRWGVVGCDRGLSVSVFQHRIKAFLSTNYDSSKMAHVACTAEGFEANRGGVFFQGFVGFKNGDALDVNPNTNTSQNLVASNESHIEIQVVTSDPLTRFVPIKLKITPSGGLVSGNFVSLAFEDEKGEVELTGEIKSNGLFEGQFSFKNYTHWTNDADQSFEGDLGIFKIKTCSFFKCIVK